MDEYLWGLFVFAMFCAGCLSTVMVCARFVGKCVPAIVKVKANVSLPNPVRAFRQRRTRPKYVSDLCSRKHRPMAVRRTGRLPRPVVVHMLEHKSAA